MDLNVFRAIGWRKVTVMLWAQIGRVINLGLSLREHRFHARVVITPYTRSHCIRRPFHGQRICSGSICVPSRTCRPSVTPVVRALPHPHSSLPCNFRPHLQVKASLVATQPSASKFFSQTSVSPKVPYFGYSVVWGDGRKKSAGLNICERPKRHITL